MKTLVKRCPFCDRVVEQRAYAVWGRAEREEDRWLFGSPMKLCPHCSRLYVDRDIRELAITDPRPQDTAVLGPASLRLAAMGAVLGALMLLARQTGFALVAFGVALATLAADAALCPTRRRKLAAERAASRARLSNPDYASALARAGYDVPGEYLKGAQGAPVPQSPIQDKEESR